MTHLTRRSLRYEMSACRSMVLDLAQDPHLSTYYDGAAVRSRGARPLPGFVEDVARTLGGFVPAMSLTLRRQLFDLLGSGPWMEPPGALFTLYEAALPELYPSNRARRIGRSRKPYRVL